MLVVVVVLLLVLVLVLLLLLLLVLVLVLLVLRGARWRRLLRVCVRALAPGGIARAAKGHRPRPGSRPPAPGAFPFEFCVQSEQFSAQRNAFSIRFFLWRPHFSVQNVL